MVSSDDAEILDIVRMMRGHGLVRAGSDPARQQRYFAAHPDLSEDFIFAFPAWNVRGTELGAVLGRSQLQRLDARNEVRRRNLALFLDGLDRRRYVTEFARDGSCNYAFTLVLREPDERLRDAVVDMLRAEGVEFRRGLSGGGNQLRQPYLRGRPGIPAPEGFPNVEHVHFFAFYIGNYPDLPEWKIGQLCDRLNALGRRA